MAPAGGGNIKVVVRCRPFNTREKDRNAQCIVQMKGNQTVLTIPNDSKDKTKKPNVFAFDRSYWSFDKSDPEYAGQDSLHEDLGRPLLDNAFQGYNNCIFAYGQTGSGKSYSMMGYGAEHGVIPKICQDMFERITAMQQDKNLQCTVEVSYLEIYNERVRDLLNPTTKGNLKVREHPATGPYVEDLAKLVVGSFIEIEHLMDEGNKARTVAATNMNETSSRSHAVFTLTLTQKRLDVDTKLSTEKVAKISLVDLAGSERANSTGATGARLKEGAEINRSLSTLGRVIAALADLSTSSKKKKNAANAVPYRDSVLTWLLKDSLGGNSMTAMIAAISPADINYDETLSTLRYADSAKRIKNHAVVNEDANARMVRELKEELASLRSKLATGGGVATGEVSYPEGTPLAEQFVSIAQEDGSVKKVSKAEIQEQLTQSEKLYSDLNQTWEEKLTKTEEIHKEREAALEELGISIEKGFVGLHTPKKMPHLVNLSDDPLLAECLVYNLKPGVTTVGNVDADASTSAEIRLNGTRILHEHCSFENADNVVTVVPREDAAVMVNGKRITEPKRLRSGYRIILGDFHIFRFNHPMEAKAERAEQSLLRHSVTASQLAAHDRQALGDIDKVGVTMSPRPSHERNISSAGSEIDWDGSRPETPSVPRGRDSDWSFARREAAGAILGADQKIAGLTDEELNILFEDVQKARAERQGERFEDDSSSTTSYPIREKYLSNGTLDNFSLDTALTVPSTPRQGEVEDRMRDMREEMQVQLDKQKEEYQDQLKNAQTSDVEVDDIKKEKERMEESLREAKAEMMQQLEEQRTKFEALIKQAKSASKSRQLDEQDKENGRKIIAHWRHRKFVRMAEMIMQNAASLKEAQIMSQEMDENVVFQFVILDTGHSLCSSYDMIFLGIPGEGDDQALEDEPRPCLAVRILDYKNSLVHLWSLEKLKTRLRSMRQVHQYIDRPEYMHHLSKENPFSDASMPQFSLIGDVDVPLAAVFERRVQDLSLDVVSPYTHSPIGSLKLAMEPSSARAPSKTIKFNVVMHDLHGFPEDEGTDVHAQLCIPGISEDGGVTTTQLIKNFDEGAIRFESVHSMGVPLSADRSTSLRVSIFAKVTSMHLDKLLSWDEMRDAVPSEQDLRQNARLAESQFHTEEKHDIFAKAQILELSETGEYEPVEVLKSSEFDRGRFQLHQGLQRRIVVNLSHNSGHTLIWTTIDKLRVGRIALLDHAGKDPGMSTPTPEIELRLIGEPTIKQNANGTTNVTLVGQWDSSYHNSLFLDRVTVDRYKVKLCLLWDVHTERLDESTTFSMDIHAQILSRAFVRQPSMFQSLFQTTRITHSNSAIFTLALRPAPMKHIGDLWRMNTSQEFVKGEENLIDWTPRGVSLVHDFFNARKRRIRLADLETARAHLSTQAMSAPVRMLSDLRTDMDAGEVTPYTGEQQKLLQKYLSLWTVTPDPITVLLRKANTSPPRDGLPASPLPRTSPRMLATITQQAKSPTALKCGHLLIPSQDNTRWIRRYVELRQPYLHIHSVPEGEEVGIVSLCNSRIDREPEIAGLLSSPSSGNNANAGSARPKGMSESRRRCVFALYGESNSWILCAPSEKMKAEWIWAVDRAFVVAEGGGDV